MKPRALLVLTSIILSLTLFVQVAAGCAADYSQFVKLPPLYTINQGLSPVSPGYLRSLFGVPGALTHDCSEVTNVKLQALIVTQDVGLETVTGLKPAVEAVQRIFAAVQRDKPDLYAQLQGQETQLDSTAMLCVRAVAGLYPADFSTHSWGIAIDVAIDGKLNPIGGHQVQLGLLALYPYFHAEGFYWGAGFLPNADPMHFEISREQLARWKLQGTIELAG
jgi:hypothetical protein